MMAGNTTIMEYMFLIAVFVSAITIAKLKPFSEKRKFLSQIFCVYVCLQSINGMKCYESFYDVYCFYSEGG